MGAGSLSPLCPGLRKRMGARGGAGVHQSCAPLLQYKKVRALFLMPAGCPCGTQPPPAHAVLHAGRRRVAPERGAQGSCTWNARGVVRTRNAGARFPFLWRPPVHMPSGSARPLCTCTGAGRKGRVPAAAGCVPTPILVAPLSAPGPCSNEGRRRLSDGSPPSIQPPFACYARLGERDARGGLCRASGFPSPVEVRTRPVYAQTGVRPRGEWRRVLHSLSPST